MPARDLTRWTQNEDGSWRMKPAETNEELKADLKQSFEELARGELIDITPRDYSELTLVQLREELVSRGLSKYGNKPELIERLREDDALS